MLSKAGRNSEIVSQIYLVFKGQNNLVSYYPNMVVNLFKDNPVIYQWLTVPVQTYASNS